MLTNQQIDQAAQHFITRRRDAATGPALPPNCRPADIDDALRIQQRVLQLLGAQVGGWKCSVPPAGGAVLAPIPHDKIFRASPCSMPLTDAPQLAAVEPEIAYVMAADLPPRATSYSPEDILQAVASTHLAFELIATRYAPGTPLELPDRLAESLSNYGLFLGPAIAAEQARENVDGHALPAFRLTLSDAVNALGGWDGKHPDGHPLRALHWLVNFLSARNAGLRRGDVVTTGSYHGLIHLPSGVPLRMSFGTLGEIAVTMQAA
ncbi:MAG TPA: 2-keto-4-pentenoate hydratase [Herbaspirillum sp.]|jgi:2-keto-4-pentenoate hydratase